MATQASTHNNKKFESAGTDDSATAMDEEDALNCAGPSTASPLPEAGELPLSKNQQKKLAKRARFQEHKLEKRAQEKERRRERNKALKAGYAAGTLSEADKAVLETRRELQRVRKVASKGKELDVFPGAIVIDLGFDDLMTDGEITSMASQLTYVYSLNRSAKRPFAAVLFTSFAPEPTASPRLWTKLGKNVWPRWTRMHFWREGVDVLANVLKRGGSSTAEGAETATVAAGGAVDSQASKDEETPAGTSSAHIELADRTAYLTGPNLPETIPSSSHLVYLSADAEEELTTLSPNEIYVIGGIVDRNRHKMLCQNKATELGIRTARLPIGTFIDNMPTRKVLTVNQVFEILVQYNSQGDWKGAFETVIPQRKYFTGKQEMKAARRAKDGDGDENMDGSSAVQSATEEASTNEVGP